MAIDVQRLRVQRHVREQHVVHLRDRARERVLVEVADHEVVEIDAAALVAAQLGILSHRLSPWGVRRAATAWWRTCVILKHLRITQREQSLGRSRRQVQPIGPFTTAGELRARRRQRAAGSIPLLRMSGAASGAAMNFAIARAASSALETDKIPEAHSEEL